MVLAAMSILCWNWRNVVGTVCDDLIKYLYLKAAAAAMSIRQKMEKLVVLQV